MPSVREIIDSYAAASAASSGKFDGTPWRSIARPEQLRPEGVDTFVVRGGRGSGKTRLGAEDCLERVRSQDGPVVHLLAPTRDDVKKTMIEGVSGILACARPGEIDLPRAYNKTELQIRFRNGVLLRGFSAAEPDRLNGPQCSHCWTDEFYAVSTHALQQSRLGLRIGRRTTSCYTSTPKSGEGTKYVLALPDAFVSVMRTRDNISNLDEKAVEDLYREYRGTRQERVELEGEVDLNVDGALWSPDDFAWRGFRKPVFNPLFRAEWESRNEPLGWIVVALDPTVADPEMKKHPFKGQDECGILVVGASATGHGYVLLDASRIASPQSWARVAIKLYRQFGANTLAYEDNQGGSLIANILKVAAAEEEKEGWRHSQELKLKAVRASDSKGTRAEPVQMLYSQHRYHHCNDPGPLPGQPGALTAEAYTRAQHMFDRFEEEMLNWNAMDAATRRKSPNRIDAGSVAAHALGLVTTFGVRKRSMRGRKQ